MSAHFARFAHFAVFECHTTAGINVSRRTVRILISSIRYRRGKGTYSLQDSASSISFLRRRAWLRRWAKQLNMWRRRYPLQHCHLAGCRSWIQHPLEAEWEGRRDPANLVWGPYWLGHRADATEYPERVYYFGAVVMITRSRWPTEARRYGSFLGGKKVRT